MSIGPGTRLGQYEVLDFIGEGAMGRVYRAYHAELERTGAVKVMQALAPDADSIARFRHEAQAIARLRHPNIVGVYDFGTFEGTPYMIVEYVPGGSLAARMDQGTLERATAIACLRGIAAGLDYAHGHGIVHRDVKPANVLLAADGTPVLADFGLAKLMQGSSLKSLTGVTTGTPAYMAPEQVTGSRVGPPADRYSLATIAYQMLTGVIPFDGEGLMEVLYAQVHRDPVPPSSRDASLGAQVDAVVMRGLAKDPAARWESAAAFVDALALALAPAQAAAVEPALALAPPVAPTVALAGAAVAERVAAPSSVPAAVGQARPAPPPAPAANRRSRKPLAGAVAAIVIAALLLAAVAGWAATHRPVTLSLSSTTVTAGGTVVVSADRLPPNQVGRVELWSAQYTFPFRAGPNGHVDVTITVPFGIAPGDHEVKICWNGACHAERTLHVLAPIAAAQVSPPPLPATPTSNASPAAPSPSASVRPSASPTPCTPVALYLPSASKLNGFSLTFRCFPAGAWTVSVVQLGVPYAAGTANVPAGGANYTPAKKFATPAAILVGQRVYVIACAGRCYESNAVTVGA